MRALRHPTLRSFIGRVLATAICLAGLELVPGPSVVPAQDTAIPNGATVRLNDFEMYYEAYGHGDPLLLLHGFNASGKV